MYLRVHYLDVRIIDHDFSSTLELYIVLNLNTLPLSLICIKRSDETLKKTGRDQKEPKQNEMGWEWTLETHKGSS